MSLLLLPNELLLNYIFSCSNLKISDLNHLMLACRDLRDVIGGSNRLWMIKFSSRCPKVLNSFPDKEIIVWKNRVFSLRVVEETKDAVVSLSSLCYPLGKSISPRLDVENWVENGGDHSFDFSDEQLIQFVYNYKFSIRTTDLTLSYYASVALKKLQIVLQVRNLKRFTVKPFSEKILLEGALLIAKWFYLTDSNELVDNIEQDFQKIVERARRLIEEKDSGALGDILTSINEVMFSEMKFRVYRKQNTNPNIVNHEAASIHKVLKQKIGYAAVVGIIYLEVAARMGIRCELVSLDCAAHYSENLILRCRADDHPETYYIGILSGGFFDPKRDDPGVVGRPACSIEDIFGQMLEAVVNRDLTCPYGNDMNKILSSLRLLCFFQPAKNNILRVAQISLDINEQVNDAYHLLMAAKIDSRERVMVEVKNRLRSQQAVMDAAKVARHRSPLIIYAVGLVLSSTYRDSQGTLKHMICVVLSWDPFYDEDNSRQKWGIVFEPITEGYGHDQAYYHVLSSQTNFYVPQEILQLTRIDRLRANHNVERLIPQEILGIFFERFDGSRYLPNAQHQLHFPEDNAVASSLVAHP